MSAQRDPIWNRQDLLQILTEHDLKYPFHPSACKCEGGLIHAIRTTLGPPKAIPVSIAPPYIPPAYLRSDLPEATRGLASRQPWLAQRENETNEAYNFRIEHSCWKCGTVIVDMKVLAVHEDFQCTASTIRDNT